MLMGLSAKPAELKYQFCGRPPTPTHRYIIKTSRHIHNNTNTTSMTMVISTLNCMVRALCSSSNTTLIYFTCTHTVSRAGTNTQIYTSKHFSSPSTHTRHNLLPLPELELRQIECIHSSAPVCLPVSLAPPPTSATVTLFLTSVTLVSCLPDGVLQCAAAKSPLTHITLSRLLTPSKRC